MENKCKNCEGTGYDNRSKCYNCNGSGLNLVKQVQKNPKFLNYTKPRKRK